MSTTPTNDAQMLAALKSLPHAELLQVGKITDPPGSNEFYSARTVALLLANEREKMQADTLRMNYLERQAIGRCSEVNGPDVFTVMFTLVEPERKTLREAVDAAMSSINCGTTLDNCGTS